MLRYLTAGESHGKCLTAIVEGIPANLKINIEKINSILALRQSGYGRGQRMKIENDKVEFLSGVRDGKTLGSPICIKINNRDWENWQKVMDPWKVEDSNLITIPRPGHADLTGLLKYDQNDITNIIERTSARETAIRVAVGCIASQLLEQFKIKVLSHIIQIGHLKTSVKFENDKKLLEKLEKSQLRCIDEELEKEMKKIIDKAKEDGDSLGGVFEIIATEVPIGLGSCMHWDRKLDAIISCGLMSVQGIKGVEFGIGFQYSSNTGSKCHDEIFYDITNGYYRKTNNAGGIEGGMSNGENIVIRAVMKPIPTLYKPLKSVDIVTKQEVQASVHRSDVCAVPAASIVGASVVSWELANAFVEKFGGDSMEEMTHNYKNYMRYLNNR